MIETNLSLMKWDRGFVPGATFCFVILMVPVIVSDNWDSYPGCPASLDVGTMPLAT